MYSQCGTELFNSTGPSCHRMLHALGGLPPPNPAQSDSIVNISSRAVAADWSPVEWPRPLGLVCSRQLGYDFQSIFLRRRRLFAALRIVSVSTRSYNRSTHVSNSLHNALNLRHALRPTHLQLSHPHALVDSETSIRGNLI